MLKPIHAEITRLALAERFSPRALEVIIAANLGQDRLRYQFGHAEFHVDSNSFEQARAYVSAQRALIRPALEQGQSPSAWSAFGRLTHCAQDLYAHSNYVAMWLAAHSNGAATAAAEIDPLDTNVLASPELHSGKLYYPLEALSFVPVLRQLVMPLLPDDSHAHMNLDSAGRGPLFEYAFQAALKRTRHEFELTTSGWPQPLTKAFRDA
jgi:hypothetical protein